jgi:hypothetical protein
MTTSFVIDLSTKQGPRPAEGVHAETLEEIKQVAARLIQLAEQERSGVCDGGGVWIGRDPLLAVARRILALVEGRGVISPQ